MRLKSASVTTAATLAVMTLSSATGSLAAPPVPPKHEAAPLELVQYRNRPNVVRPFVARPLPGRPIVVGPRVVVPRVVSPRVVVGPRVVSPRFIAPRGYAGRPYWFARPWGARPYYGTVVAGVALGTILTVTALRAAPPRPDPNLCWYWEDDEGSRGYWDYCSE